MAEEIDITINCPICKKSIISTIDKKIIVNALKFPVPFKIEHCGNQFIIFIDANYKCAKTQLLTIIKNEEEYNHPTDTTFNSVISPDDLVMYEFNSESGFLLDRIPDLTEKHLIRIILRNKGVSLGKLIQECAVLGKALNRNISRENILNILENYVEKEIIIKHEVKIEEEESFSQFKTNMLQGGNI